MDGIGQAKSVSSFQLFLGIVVGFAVLHYARQIFIPVAVAILLSFLLAPLVQRLTRWQWPNVLAVTSTLLFASLVLAVLFWVISLQFINLAENLPSYQNNLQAKISTLLNVDEDSPFSRAFRTLSDIRQEIEEEVQEERERERNAAGETEAEPIPVELRPVAPGPLEMLRQYGEPLLEPLGTAGLAVVFLVFILLQRNDLRERMIKLVSGGNINRATEAVDEISHRISRYLLMHTFINVCYGVPVALGLYFIGVPNALLWGILATLLRFIPFIGAWIAAFFPVSLSFAVDPGWTMPLLTLGLILVLELFSNNVLEPWLYGSSTGISAVALIFAALVWTWTWGPIGLFLATPITVCLVVIGKYVPSLGFLNTLFGTEPVLSPEARLYQRMLTMDQDALHEQAEQLLAGRPLTDFYDQVLVPALVLAERDRYGGHLAENRQAFIIAGTHALLDDLAEGWVGEDEQNAPLIFCVPARDPADELASRMLAQVLQQNGLRAESRPLNEALDQLTSEIAAKCPLAVCLCALPPGALIATRKLCRQLQRRGVDSLLIAAIWGAREGATELQRRLGEQGQGPDRVATSISDTLMQVKMAQGGERGDADLSVEEHQWQRELDATELAQVPREELLEAIYRKLAEVFELPLPLVSLADHDRQFWHNHLGKDYGTGGPSEKPEALPLGESMGGPEELTLYQDLADSPWAEEALVTQRGIHFFASAPLLTAEGHYVGELCVMDTRSRQVEPRQRWYLRALARLLMRRLEQGPGVSAAE